uniref:RCC1 domain-containing protein 1-like n=1 Tax=Doryrhamphus excisus TaxID=161450 RepID=UPI0025AEAC0B|nr:RCC1 domain-containing protein 1-like [Doryrhamphus excisus]
MRWFAFGFNAFGQLLGHESVLNNSDIVDVVKVVNPTELKCHVNGSCCRQTSGVRASWSRRASLHSNDGGSLCLAGFNDSNETLLVESRGCKDAAIGESYLILAFADRVESWDLNNNQKTPSWSMDVKTGKPLNLPLIPGGYIDTSPPFYHPLSPHLNATRLALGAGHCILLSAAGAVYTWGLGSHGQLGHGGLSSEEEPRVVEALWGMSMTRVATGGWHSVCISDGGDLYVWGWNESGQLGLPSQAVRSTERCQNSQQVAGVSSCKAPPDEEKKEEVFISIQAFPALLDITASCEVKSADCGSRHTAAVTSTGDLYTWGWGEYGQLGYETSCSDEPRRVEYFRKQQMRVVDVTCGAWNTFAAIVKEEASASYS